MEMFQISCLTNKETLFSQNVFSIKHVYQLIYIVTKKIAPTKVKQTRKTFFKFVAKEERG